MTIGKRLDELFSFPHKRIPLIVVAMVELLWFSGYYYGFNALIKPYKSLGVFSSFCENQTVTTCKEQDNMFQTSFVIWVVIQMVCVSFVGFALDRVGLRPVKLLAVSMFTVGSVMFAFTEANSSYLLFPAGILVAVGGTTSLMCNFQISSMFPKLRGLTISLMSGAFDSSTLVTYIIGLTVPGISLRTSLLLLACFGLLTGLIVGVVGLKQWSVDMAVVDNKEALAEKTIEAYCEKEEAETPCSGSAKSNIDDRIQDIIRDRYPGLLQCFRSPVFLLVTLWFMFGLLRFSNFLSNMKNQLDHMFGENSETSERLQLLSSLLLMGGIVVAPISGFVIDSSRGYYRRKLEAKIEKHGSRLTDEEIYAIHIRGFAPAFLLLAISSLITSLMSFVKSQVAFFISFLFFTILRSLLFSASVGFILIAFPLQKFGTVNGVMNTIAGIFSLIQRAIAMFDIRINNGLVVGVSLVLFITPMLLFFKKRF